jgi:hypothetical protein
VTEHLQQEDISVRKRMEVTKLPVRNKIQINPTNSSCISLMLTAVKRVLQGDSKERRHDICLKDFAVIQTLLKKGTEARRRKSHLLLS